MKIFLGFVGVIVALGAIETVINYRRVNGLRKALDAVLSKRGPVKKDAI